MRYLLIPVLVLQMFFMISCGSSKMLITESTADNLQKIKKDCEKQGIKNSLSDSLYAAAMQLKEDGDNDEALVLYKRAEYLYTASLFNHRYKITEKECENLENELSNVKKTVNKYEQLLNELKEMNIQ